MTIFDAIHPLDHFWFDGEPPDRIENILRRKRFDETEERRATVEWTAQRQMLCRDIPEDV